MLEPYVLSPGISHFSIGCREGVHEVLGVDAGTVIQDMDFFSDRIAVWLRRDGIPGLGILPLSGRTSPTYPRECNHRTIIPSNRAGMPCTVLV